MVASSKRLRASVCSVALCLGATVVLGGETTSSESERGTSATRVLPPGVMTCLDVAYLSWERGEKLDLYLPENRDASVRSPAVVMIHGGGWKGGSKSGNREFVTGTYLAQAGYVCASVEYKKDGDDRFPTNFPIFILKPARECSDRTVGRR